MRKLAVIPLTLFALAGAAHAQVYKCKEDGTGKITFSDVPCHGKNAGHAVDVRPTNQFDGSGLRQEAERERWQEQARRYSSSGSGSIGDGDARRRSSNSSRDSTCEQMLREPANSRAKRAALAAACGSSAPEIRDEPTSMPAPLPAPTTITNCDSAGCWDNMGGRYNKGGGTTYFPASGGGACQMIGGVMRCP